MPTMRSIVKRERISVEVVHDRGSQIDEDKWEHHAYKIRLKIMPREDPDRFSEEFGWSQGMGVETSPVDRPEEVLDCLIGDAAAYDDALSFEDFARTFGYDEDSRKAERMYLACGETAKWLRHFLGDQLFSRVQRAERI